MPANDNKVNPITPKRITEVYRGHKYTLQFMPKAQLVHWSVPWTVLGFTINYYEDRKTFASARKAVHTQIDQLIDGKSKI